MENRCRASHGTDKKASAGVNDEAISGGQENVHFFPSNVTDDLCRTIGGRFYKLFPIFYDPKYCVSYREYLQSLYSHATTVCYSCVVVLVLVLVSQPSSNLTDSHNDAAPYFILGIVLLAVAICFLLIKLACDWSSYRTNRPTLSAHSLGGTEGINIGGSDNNDSNGEVACLVQDTRTMRKKVVPRNKSSSWLWNPFNRRRQLYRASCQPSADEAASVTSATGQSEKASAHSTTYNRIVAAIVYFFLNGNLENFVGLSVVFGLGFILLARVMSGRCPHRRSEDQWTCNPGSDSGAVPTDSVLLLYISPVMTQASMSGGIDFRVSVLSCVVSTIFIAISISVIHETHSELWTLIFSVIFMYITIAYERFTRLSFLQYEANIAAEKGRQETMSDWLKSEYLLEMSKMQKESAEKESETLRNLIGNIAHDMKTPLQSISMGISVLSSSLNDINNAGKDTASLSATTTVAGAVSSSMELINILDATCSFMSMAINRVLDFTKASSGIELVPHTVATIDLMSVIASTVFQMNCVQSVPIIVGPLPPHISRMVETDMQWLSENLLCLMSNAVKYHTNGIVTVDIEIVPCEESKGTIAGVGVGGVGVFRGNSVMSPSGDAAEKERDNYESEVEVGSHCSTSIMIPNADRRESSATFGGRPPRGEGGPPSRDGPPRLILAKPTPSSLRSTGGAASSTPSKMVARGKSRIKTSGGGGGGGISKVLPVSSDESTIGGGPAAAAGDHSSPQKTVGYSYNIVPHKKSSSISSLRKKSSLKAPSEESSDSADDSKPCTPCTSLIAHSSTSRRRLHKSSLGSVGGSVRMGGGIDRFGSEATPLSLSCLPSQPSSSENLLQNLLVEDIRKFPPSLIRITVEDTGPGVHPKLFKTIFEDCTQRQRVTGGTGLGLFSLSKRVESLGGSCGVTSRRDGKSGAAFWFTFPYKPAVDDVIAQFFAEHEKDREANLGVGGKGEEGETEPEQLGLDHSIEGFDNNPFTQMGSFIYNNTSAAPTIVGGSSSADADMTASSPSLSTTPDTGRRLSAKVSWGTAATANKLQQWERGGHVLLSPVISNQQSLLNSINGSYAELVDDDFHDPTAAALGSGGAARPELDLATSISNISTTILTSNPNIAAVNAVAAVATDSELRIRSSQTTQSQQPHQLLLSAGDAVVVDTDAAADAENDDDARVHNDGDDNDDDGEEDDGNDQLPPQPIRFLVVDDSFVILKMVATILEREGHRVETAKNGLIAVEKLTSSMTNGKSSFDVVLIDLQMPVMDGFEAMRLFRQHESSPPVHKNEASSPDEKDVMCTSREGGRSHLLMIAASANSDSSCREAALGAGADYFLPKPFAWNELLPILWSEGLVEGLSF